MADFCDVALPVPLEANFTYRLNGSSPVIGGRVVVPFREKKLSGIVVALHDRPPSVPAKSVLTVLDAAPVLDPSLMRLGQCQPALSSLFHPTARCRCAARRHCLQKAALYDGRCHKPWRAPCVE